MKIIFMENSCLSVLVFGDFEAWVTGDIVRIKIPTPLRKVARQSDFMEVYRWWEFKDFKMKSDAVALDVVEELFLSDTIDLRPYQAR